jgi:hypothetical protein
LIAWLRRSSAPQTNSKVEIVSTVAHGVGPPNRSSRESVRTFGSRFVRTLATGTTAGIAAAFLVGGLGGRLVMRILAITSGQEFTGVITDNGNRVNEFTRAGTVELILFATAFFTLGGWVYILVRRWLPGTGWRKGLAFGVVLAAGEQFVFDNSGKDFAILRPVALSVVLFDVVLPLLYGVVVVAIADRLDAFYAGARWSSRNIIAFAPLLILVALYFVLPVFVLVFIIAFLIFRSPSRRIAWEGGRVDRVGRVLLALFCAAGLVLAVYHAVNIDPRPLRPTDFRAETLDSTKL